MEEASPELERNFKSNKTRSKIILNLEAENKSQVLQ
jgi:hypothetical protein